MFPTTNSENVGMNTKQTVVATPVIAATVGLGMDFSNIDPPVEIVLEVNEWPENDNFTVCTYIQLRIVCAYGVYMYRCLKVKNDVRHGIFKLNAG